MPKLQTVWLLYENESTSLSGYPDLKGVALSKEDADWWQSTGDDPWNSRRIYETKVVSKEPHA